ncbi:toxin RelE [Clostridia bacterium]|nr:toxin RelE [Clostridia bacterium]
MTREFILMPEFERQWKNMDLDDDDLSRFEEEILRNPATGSVISGTGGLRKVRFAYDGKGKSGSVRVLYVDFVVSEQILLIYAYPKNKKATITKEERNSFKKLITTITTERNHI